MRSIISLFYCQYIGRLIVKFEIKSFDFILVAEFK